jgi:hypothetical protein
VTINRIKTQLALTALTIIGVAFNIAAAEDKPLKVFNLAGQSNMEGQCVIDLNERRAAGYKQRGLSEEAIAKKRKGSLENLLKDPDKANAYKNIVGKDGEDASTHARSGRSVARRLSNCGHVAGRMKFMR